MKKVLIISYYWPPSGGIGVHRCLKFAKYLRNFGWEPIIYTAKKAQYPYIDESNFVDIPDNLEVLRHRIFEPFKVFKILSGRKLSEPLSNPVHVREKKQSLIDKFSIWIRGNFFIPDARAFWIRPSVRYLSKYIRNNKIDAILSDGPPHTNTYIAYKISKKFNIPWLADFQDPWTQVDYYKDLMLMNFADKKHKRMEQEVFKQASKITVASPDWARELEKIGAGNVSEIYWGYDEDDFKKVSDANSDGKFIISHSGLLGMDRNPETLFETIAEIIQEDSSIKDKFRIIFPGMIDYSVKLSVEKCGLNAIIEYPGNIKRREVLELNARSAILLLPLNKAENAKGRIPGKLFEYLRSGNQILCLGPRNSDAGSIILNSKRGICCEYEEKIIIKEFILKVYNNFLNNTLTNSDSDISEYSVENQTGKIASFLNEII
ncbi:MAG: hypothetical protein K9H49_15540 [Bacteroidales bacterium]|nr:hypothetical protein [Bacteroidales bacterium]MCF8405481.1 hypothetical protein [Bacteroidales bacterium]